MGGNRPEIGQNGRNFVAKGPFRLIRPPFDSNRQDASIGALCYRKYAVIGQKGPVYGPKWPQMQSNGPQQVEWPIKSKVTRNTRAARFPDVIATLSIRSITSVRLWVVPPPF